MPTMKEVWNCLDLKMRILFFLGFLFPTITLLWATGKLLGWIHSPIWVQVLPMIMNSGGIVLSLFVLVFVYYEMRQLRTEMGHIRSDMHRMQEDIRELKQDMRELRQDVRNMDKRLIRVEAKVLNSA